MTLSLSNSPVPLGKSVLLPRSSEELLSDGFARSDEAAVGLANERQLRLEVSALFSKLRPEMKRLIERHLDRRLRRRVDPSDVVQSAYIDVQDRLTRFLAERPMEVRPWLFFLTKMKTFEINQHHLASQKRNVGREQNCNSRLMQVCDRQPSPSQIVSRRETQEGLMQAIDRLPAQYRMVIQMRHLQARSNQDVSESLGISANAASKLYVRALHALKDSMHST